MLNVNNKVVVYFHLLTPIIWQSVTNWLTTDLVCRSYQMWLSAALPLVGVSAWRALVEDIGLSKDQKVSVLCYTACKVPRRGGSNNSKCRRQAVC